MTKSTVGSGLTEYDAEFGYDEAKHLLNRALFGPKHSEILSFASKTLTQAVDDLLDETETTTDFPLVNKFAAPEETVAQGTTWVNDPEDADNNERRMGLTAWQMGQMIEQAPTFREKMGLFFFNHIPVQRTVNTAVGLFDFAEIFKNNYLGNLKDIVKAICIDHAMMRFLNGGDNKATAPNENFARELLELFTIGKGPQIGEGDYTHYTEEDVKSAARVMTGWRIRYSPREVYFQESWHDTEPKTFSAAFNNTVIENQGDKEFEALVDMIFEQKECARFFVRKLYRFFVHYHIDETIENNVINGLANTLHNGDYELRPLYERLFKSRHFFDQRIRGGLISSQVEYVVGTLRRLQVELPPKNEVDKRHLLIQRNFDRFTESIGQQLLNPPSVAGWQAYYTAPSFHRKWMDSLTFPARQKFALSICLGVNKTQENITYSFGLNMSELRLIISDVSDYKLMAAELSEFLIPRSLPEESLNQMATDLYLYTLQNPMATEDDKITLMVQAIMILPEFQLV